MENEFNERTNDEKKEFDTDTVNQVNESTIKNESNDSNKDGGELWIMLGIGVFLLLVFSIGFFVYYKRNTIPPSPVFPEADDGWIPLTPEENKNEGETIDIPLTSEFSDKEKDLPLKDEKEEIIIKDAEGTKVSDIKSEEKSEAKEATDKPLPSAEEAKAKSTQQKTGRMDGLKEKDVATIGSNNRNTSETSKTQNDGRKSTGSTASIKSKGVEKKESAKNLPKNSGTAIAKNTSQNRTVQKIDKNNTSLDIKRYWIQVASLKSKKSADEARLELEKNKMPVNVFTYKGKDDAIYYRIRVGPYASKEEAEYWLRKISDIAFFKNEKCYVAGVE